MAMTIGGRGGAVHQINVTPMIDVLLVLLVIFMVVQQGLARGVSVHVPAPDPLEHTSTATDDNILLTVEPGGRYLLNTMPIPRERLREVLAQVYDGRPRRVLFVKGDEALTYAEVVAAVDAARSAGIVIVGLVPRTADAGG